MAKKHKPSDFQRRSEIIILALLTYVFIRTFIGF